MSSCQRRDKTVLDSFLCLFHSYIQYCPEFSSFCLFFTFLSLSHISSARSLFYSSEGSEVSSYFRGNKLSVSLCLQLLRDLKAAFLLFSVLVTFSVKHTHTHKPYSDTEALLPISFFFSFFSFLKSAEEEDDAGYLDVAVSELKHPPPQLSPMPEGLTNHQVQLTAAPSHMKMCNSYTGSQLRK